ncbi:MAG: hypothetical protein GX036_07985 [Firmicutes bacterium]|jgi:hypothetical protein|nr:hypothetical protein [Bacillota bacterium]
MAAIIIGNLIGAGIYASLWYLIVLRGQKKAKKEKLKELILNTLLFLVLYNTIPYLIAFIR